MAAWKDHERRVARKLGGTRTGNRGRAAADVTTDWAAAECKERATLPMWLRDAVEQATATARQGQLPLVVLHEFGTRSDNDLVVLRMRDFLRWFGDVAPAAPEQET